MAASTAGFPSKQGRQPLLRPAAYQGDSKPWKIQRREAFRSRTGPGLRGPEQLVEPPGRVALERRHHVRVGVERQRDLRVPEALLHDLRVDALREQQARVRVAQVVEAHPRQPGAREQ